tara:strand:- start:1478 stop:1645 length:168 start_codon:yes stop_codon:yes gene_type:complete
MKHALRNICFVATGINLPIIGLGVYMKDPQLFLLGASSGVLTLFGALFVYAEDEQ